jgi:predicted acyltransferase
MLMTLPVQRFTALDVFRGLTICLMIIVNTPGNGATTFSPLLHASWHGFTPTDLVFPSFLFAVGNAISFVMPKWQNVAQNKVLFKIFKRTCIIFLLGYLMYWFPFVKWNIANQIVAISFDDTRVFGVLQRIALCYCFASLLIYYCKPKMVVIVSVFLLIAYWIILFFLGDAIAPYSMQGNAGQLLDKWLLNQTHLYHGEGVAFDPEGLLSTMPAIVNVTAGYLVGKYIQAKGDSYQGLTTLLIAGALLLFAAYCCNLFFPINKKLWTSSFVLHTVGLDCIIIAIIIYCINFKKLTKGIYFFEVFGRNPLFIYLLSEMLATVLYFIKVNSTTSLYKWIYQTIYVGVGNYVGSFLFAISIMLICWLVGYWLDKKKWYIKV